LVDANVLIDVVTDDPRWASWSARALAAAADRGPLVINPVVYAEISVEFDTLEELDAA
jgi:predicted nucleic acid-binding protein